MIVHRRLRWLSAWMSVGALLSCLLASVVASAAEPPVVRRFEDDPIGVVEIDLDNGLTVLLSENHSRAEIFGAVVVRAGGKNDPPEHTGIAHYLEHMLFKGTQTLGTIDYEQEAPHLAKIDELYRQYAETNDEGVRARLGKEIDAAAQAAGKWAIPNELDHLLAEIGGTRVNAFTSNDITAYYNLFPSSQIETWLDIYAHRFEEPVFRLFPSELEAVYEEKNRSMDGFMEPAYEAFMRSFFEGHPYGEQPVLGTVEHLKKPSLKAMREFYDRYYVASNMALVLSGDFVAAEVAPLIAERFGRWRKGEPNDAKLPEVEHFEGRVAVTKRLTPIRAAALAFHTPGLTHDDYAPLQIARRVLANDDKAGLLDRLTEDGKLLLSMVIPLDFHTQDGLVVLYAPRIVTQSMGRAESLVRGAIDELRGGKVEAERIEAARKNYLREIESQWEDNEDRALVMADTWARGSSWNEYLLMLKAAREATPAQVATATDHWLGDDYLSYRSRVGFNKPTKLTKPDYTAVVPGKHAESTFSKELHPLPEVKAKPRFVDFDRSVKRLPVAKGVELIAADNPHNDIYTLRVRYGVGHEAVPELARLAEYLPKVGTKERGADGFSAALYALATTLNMYTTDEEFVIELSGPEADLDEALELLAELMAEPAVDRRRLRAIKREAWATERVYRDEPQEVAEALWEHVLYGDHSAMRRRGMRALRKVGLDTLLTDWRKVQQREAKLHYIGKRNSGEVARLLAKALPWAPEPVAAELPVYRPRAELATNQVFFVPKRDTVQAQLWFFIEGDPVGPDEAAKRDAYDEYLAGSMGGLIFQEIREYRALAYSAYGGFDEADVANRPGHYFGYVGCQADKTEEAIDVMKRLIDDMPSKPERVPTVRGALLRSQETDDPEFRELPQAITRWRWQGYATDPRRLRMREYAEMDWEDIESFWKDHIAGRPVTLMVVGDPRRIDKKMLAKYGPVTTIREPTLYTP